MLSFNEKAYDVECSKLVTISVLLILEASAKAKSNALATIGDAKESGTEYT